MRSLLPWPSPRPRAQKPRCSRRVRLLPSAPTPSLQRPLTMTSLLPWPQLRPHVCELRVRLPRPSRRSSLSRPPPPPLGMPWVWEPPLLRLWPLLPRLLSVLLHFSLAGPPSAGWACPLRMHHTLPPPSFGARRPSAPMSAPVPPLSMAPLPRLLSLSRAGWRRSRWASAAKGASSAHASSCCQCALAILQRPVVRAHLGRSHSASGAGPQHHGGDLSCLDLSIFRARPGSGRAQKKFCYFGPKKSCP
jgi:hypothetical protein